MSAGPSWLDNPTDDREPVEPVISDDERLIAELADHPGWIALRAAIDAHEDAWGQRIAGQITRGTKPLDQERITYVRGYFAGMRNMVGRVVAAKERVKQEAAS